MPERREEVSAGGLVVRRRKGDIEALVAEQRDRNTRSRAVRLPKGRLDRGESLEEAALREVREEVGLEARLIAPLGSVSYVFYERRSKRHIPKRVHFFLMAWVAGDAHPADGEMDAVAWVSLAEAERRLTFDAERGIVARARTLLESGQPPPL
jgi:8-oxo-dGTP diphosphatase